MSSERAEHADVKNVVVDMMLKNDAAYYPKSGGSPSVLV